MTAKQPLFFDVYIYASEFFCGLQNMQNTNRASLSLIVKQFLAVLHRHRSSPASISSADGSYITKSLMNQL